MESIATKVMIPKMQVYEMVQESDDESIIVRFQNGESYLTRPKHHEIQGTQQVYYVYPVLFCKNGLPWDAANLYLLNAFEESYSPVISPAYSKSEDLLAFLKFIESNAKLNWMVFDDFKPARPTYRYRSQLVQDINTGDIAHSVASRRMNTVIDFYRWLEREDIFVPRNPPWVETDKLIPTDGHYGDRHFIAVKSTDLSIPVPKLDDPFDEYVVDEGRLRPLPGNEQAWLLEALEAAGNTEMTLMHMLALETGGRIQTDLTIRVRNILRLKTNGKRSVPLAVGPGTGIDTKFSKRMVLQVPWWLVDGLKSYAGSDRARARRRQAVGGDTEDQYLFLTEHSNPYYMAKDDFAYMEAKKLRHFKRGQALRQNIADSIIPVVRERHDPNFSYRFHDLRATYGMNMVDQLEDDLRSGKISYDQVLELVRVRMGHNSRTVTERYLKFRVNRELLRSHQDGWERRLQNLTASALGVQ